jgi:hypothetical protein
MGVKLRKTLGSKRKGRGTMVPLIICLHIGFFRHVASKDSVPRSSEIL